LQRHGAPGVRVIPDSPGHLLPLADNPSQAASAPLSDGFYYALLRKP
jgi:16S rRNA (cytosine967-C5)-methyltransferase